jgi:PhnB protein
MSERPLFERLDEAIRELLTSGEAAGDGELEPYVRIARGLRDLPRPSFRKRLKADLRGGKMTVATEPQTTVRQMAAPRLRVKNAAAAIEFYKKAFAAHEVMRFAAGGSIAHAELVIGNSIVMVAEEAPQYGFPGPEALGGSPVAMHLYVDDADAWAERAVAAGARLVTPVSDQFYGDRSGHVADPFGYGWTIASRKEDLTVDEMQQRMAAMEAQRTPAAATFIRKGFRTVTPYLVVEDVPGEIDFLVRTFGAEETYRAATPGGMHAEVRIGDSMLMVGGGTKEQPLSGRRSQPAALHIYVENTDDVHRRAVQAGATSIGEPIDQPYGERSGGVKDAAGNVWYIATYQGDHYVPPGFGTVNVYLHPLRAEPLIKFLERAFGASKVEKYASPDGVIHHAHAVIGDSVIEMGEAHGPYQPMPTMFYVYVENADASYRRALEAGATSVHDPVDQPYGERTAAVDDAFGNQWHLATPLRQTP